MKIYIFLFLSGLLISSCSHRNRTNTSDELIEFADSLFQSSIDSSFIAGASVLVYKDGELLLDKSYGYASLELTVPMPENGVFRIASVTKHFTAAAIIKLLEEGRLSLDDDITEYLDFDTKGRKITIHHLLNHTSGIPGYTELPGGLELLTREFNRDTLLRFIENSDLLFEPGEALIYSNSGYTFLGFIIEEVTGLDYGEYLKKQFFDPLGMENTSVFKIPRSLLIWSMAIDILKMD